MSQTVEHILAKIKQPDDIIYEVYRTEKRSGWFHFWDFIMDMLFDTTTPLANEKMTDSKILYLVAADNNGQIVEIKNGHITQTIEVPGWTSRHKHKFKRIVIEKHVYRKVKKLL